MFGGNGAMLGFITSNPKYPRGPKGLGGSNPPPLGSNGLPIKTFFDSQDIYVYTLTSCVSLKI
jgi:hypothetical protein